MGATLIPTPAGAAGPSPSPQDHEPQIRRLISLCWRERWIILTAVAISVTLGVVYVARRGTIWSASSRLYVERTGPSILNAGSLMMPGGKNYANTQAELLRSTPILEKALAKRGFADRKMFEGVHNPVAWLKRALKVSVGRNDDVIRVSLDSQHVEDACTVVNAVVDRYIAFHTGKKQSTRRAFLEHLEEQRDKHITEFGKTQTEMAKFKELNSVLGLGQDEAATFQIKRLHEVYGSLDKAESAESDAHDAWTRARNLARNPRMLRMLLPEQGEGFGGFSPEQGIENQLWTLRAERALLASKVTKKHPGLTELDLHIAELEKQMAAFAGESQHYVKDYVAYLQATWQAAKATVEARRTRVGVQEKLVREMTKKNISYSALTERGANTRERIGELTKLIEQLKLDDINEDDKSLMNIMVLDPATPSTASVTTSRFAAIGMSLILGLLAGFGLAWLRDVSDQRLRTTDDVKSTMQLPVLGTLPRASLEEENDAIQIWETRREVAEAARSLRTALFFGMPKDEGTVVQVTSADPSEGKSLISSMLSIAMAQAGQRTLIIDADLRRPTQVGLFGVRDDVGLSTALTSNTPISELIQNTHTENLDIMTSGPIPTNPAELLNGPEFGRLLEELGEHYDRILVDSAPIMPVADSRIIAPKCDATILVLRAASTTTKRALAARDTLLSVGANILGTVLNDQGAGMGYGYGYGYGYGNEYIHPEARETRRGRQPGKRRGSRSKKARTKETV